MKTRVSVAIGILLGTAVLVAFFARVTDGFNASVALGLAAGVLPAAALLFTGPGGCWRSKRPREGVPHGGEASFSSDAGRAPRPG